MMSDSIVTRRPVHYYQWFAKQIQKYTPTHAHTHNPLPPSATTTTRTLTHPPKHLYITEINDKETPDNSPINTSPQLHQSIRLAERVNSCNFNQNDIPIFQDRIKVRQSGMNLSYRNCWLKSSPNSIFCKRLWSNLISSLDSTSDWFLASSFRHLIEISNARRISKENSSPNLIESKRIIPDRNQSVWCNYVETTPIDTFRYKREFLMLPIVRALIWSTRLQYRSEINNLSIRMMKCWMWNVDWINSTVVLLDNLWIAYRYGANLAKLVVKTSHSQRYDYFKQPLPPVWMMHINPTPSFYQFMDVSEIARRHLSIFPSLRNRKKQNCFDLSSPPLPPTFLSPSLSLLLYSSSDFKCTWKGNDGTLPKFLSIPPHGPI